MNDITYRPFIRDSALGDINIQIPNLEIPVYKPRYSQPLEDDTETEVQSQVEEIRNPEPQFINSNLKRISKIQCFLFMKDY